jgi:hypothetical protein
MSYNIEVIFSFEQKNNELLIDAWERFRGLAYEREHGLTYWMIMHTFYCGMSMNSKSYENYKSKKPFLELTTPADAINLLDGLLLEKKVKISLDKTDMPSEPFDDRYEIFDLNEEEKQVEKVKMLSDKINEPLLDLDKCSLDELINILQSFANDPSFNVHQTGFGSNIANRVIKEKVQR